MKFGILYNTDYYPAAHQSPSNYYAQLLEQTELAEKLGFDAVWFGEHHYSGYSFGSPSLIAMAAATRTRRIRLGTGVSLIPLHHTIRLADEYAMLDVLSGGRLEYGIGRGFSNTRTTSSVATRTKTTNVIVKGPISSSRPASLR